MPSHEQIKAMLRERQRASEAENKENHIEKYAVKDSMERDFVPEQEPVTNHEGEESFASEFVQDGVTEPGLSLESEALQESPEPDVSVIPEGNGQITAPVVQSVVPEELSVVKLVPAEPASKKRGRGRPKTRKPEKVSEKENIPMSRVDLPTSLVRMAAAQIPAASTNSEAVAAWLFAKSDQMVDVPDRIKELSRSCTGDQTVNILKDMNEHMAAMDSRMRSFNALSDGKMQELWYMMAYLMLERMDELQSPAMSKLDLSLPVFDTLMGTLRQQVTRERNRMRMQQGKTIR